ncbi:molybdenum cofactor biosynthesis protein B [Pontibacillus salicampi]|uniref:Molybdenum cofactor biosynthesis protein B n=1 Tax=Pontibacillus salicampi TaxID=1449801 RepID=A0ABV6LIV6_9BACI
MSIDSKDGVGLNCKVITISDTRTEQTDKSGRIVKEYVEGAGHNVVAYELVKDEEAAIEESVLAGCQNKHIDVIITSGGTGIAKRDVTIETVGRLLEKEMVGFGELFRMLSFTEDIGSKAMLSRAIAGVRAETVIFSAPGSSGAVTLAMKRLILPELYHCVTEVRK